MANERLIKPVENNKDKERTYREYKEKYNRAVQYNFFFEALLIDYALLEDRLYSIIYHTGFIPNRNSIEISKEKAPFLRELIAKEEGTEKKVQLSIKNISGKIKIVRNVIKWVMEPDKPPIEDKHLATLQAQCEKLNVVEFLSVLDELDDWCRYRNEVIHALMNKNVDSVSEDLQKRVADGMKLANYFDNQGKKLRRGNKIRNSANLQTS